MESNITPEEKVELFDALFNCDRMRVLGYAREGPTGNEGEIQHIGVDFWVKHPPVDTSDNAKATFLGFLRGIKNI